MQYPLTTKPVEVGSVEEFVKCITLLTTGSEYDEYLRRKVFLFRGQSNIEYELKPSLARYKNGIEDLGFVERNMIEMAKYKMPQVFSGNLQPIELLALLQHYGIPTRLLDVTENALVALYFACVSGKNSDGEVFIFMDLEDSICNYPIVNAIADSYRFAIGSFNPLSSFFEEVLEQPYFLEQEVVLKKLYKDSKEGGHWIEACCDSPFFVYAPFVVDRQKNQSGRYLLFPNKIEHNSIVEGSFLPKIEPLSKEHECVKMRIRIPAVRKQEILRNLQILGISRENLFSDSLDIVCEEIKNRFFV